MLSTFNVVFGAELGGRSRLFTLAACFGGALDGRSMLSTRCANFEAEPLAWEIIPGSALGGGIADFLCSDPVVGDAGRAVVEVAVSLRNGIGGDAVREDGVLARGVNPCCLLTAFGILLLGLERTGLTGNGAGVCRVQAGRALTSPGQNVCHGHCTCRS